MIDKLRPLYDRLLVKKLAPESKTCGGIIIPEMAQDKTQTGTVVAIGQGKRTPEGKTIPMSVSINDIVFFGKYAGLEYDTEHIIIKEDEILGIVEKELSILNNS